MKSWKLDFTHMQSNLILVNRANSNIVENQNIGKINASKQRRKLLYRK